MVGNFQDATAITIITDTLQKKSLRDALEDYLGESD
jgi:hypothetical protein